MEELAARSMNAALYLRLSLPGNLLAVGRSQHVTELHRRIAHSPCIVEQQRGQDTFRRGKCYTPFKLYKWNLDDASISSLVRAVLFSNSERVMGAFVNRQVDLVNALRLLFYRAHRKALESTICKSSFSYSSTDRGRVCNDHYSFIALSSNSTEGQLRASSHQNDKREDGRVCARQLPRVLTRRSSVESRSICQTLESS